MRSSLSAPRNSALHITRPDVDVCRLSRSCALKREDAEMLLQAAGMSVDLASEVWIDALVELAMHTPVGDPLPYTARLVIAIECARHRHGAPDPSARGKSPNSHLSQDVTA